MVLADTSVWVGHLRDDNPALREFLEDGRIVIHPFVSGELACGVLEPRAGILS